MPVFPIISLPSPVVTEQEAPSSIVEIDKDACCVCGEKRRVMHDCANCDRSLCSEHWVAHEHFCGWHDYWCPSCDAKYRRGEL